MVQIHIRLLGGQTVTLDAEEGDTVDMNKLQEQFGSSWRGALAREAFVAASEADQERKVTELERNLAAAESRVRAAEKRYQNVNDKVEEERAKPLADGTAARKPSADGPGLAEIEAKKPSDVYEPPERHTTGAKNTSARTQKEVSRDKWLANRSAETRVWERTKKARENLRRHQRGGKLRYERAEVEECVDDVSAPPSQEARPPQPRREPLFESDEVKSGAKSLAERLKCLKGRPSEVDKKAGLLKVLSAGRENYFSSEPVDILQDLQKRGLVEESLGADLLALLQKDVVDSKGNLVPAGDWSKHAQTASGIERKEDEAYKESEIMYLKWADREGLVNAEAELDAAQVQLEELLTYVDACLPNPDAVERDSATKVNTKEQEIDEDYADKMAGKLDPERQSKGSKNASALNPKVISREKWLADRNIEERERTGKVKAREGRRTEARDRKQGSAIPDED